MSSSVSKWDGMTLKFQLDSVKYGKSGAFQDLPQATKFYHGHSLTVAQTARGMGTMKMAQDLLVHLFHHEFFQPIFKDMTVKQT